MSDDQIVTAEPLRDEYARRLAAVQAGMREDGLDVLISADSGDWLHPTGDARYLTGFTIQNLAPVFAGSAIVVPAVGEPVLVTPSGPQGGFADWARETVHGARVLDASTVSAGIVDAVHDVAGSSARVGVGRRFDDFPMVHERLARHDLVDAGASDVSASGRSPLDRARAVKSETEIELLSAAQAAADAGMAAFEAAALPGARNLLAQSNARSAAIAAGGDDALIIMNAGTDPWMWWHYQGERTIPERGLVSVEVNGRVGGYVAQLARTWAIGAPDSTQRRILDAGTESIAAMVSALRPGATGHDVWRAGIAPLRAATLTAWGRLGHGMGLAMDEGVAVVEGDETELEIGTVIAVHAAAWDPDSRQSGLVGEQYVITADGAAPLSTATPPRVRPDDEPRHRAGGTA